MKMSVPTMGPNTDFKQWKEKLPELPLTQGRVPHPRDGHPRIGRLLDEKAQHYAYTVLLHATNAYQRADQAMKCVSPACPDCATAAWDIMCERI
jgi:hypothetical protein